MIASTIELLRERHARIPFVVRVHPRGVMVFTDTRGTFELETMVSGEDEWHEAVLPEGLLVSFNIWQDDVVPWLNEWYCTVYPVSLVGGALRKEDTAAGIKIEVKEA